MNRPGGKPFKIAKKILKQEGEKIQRDSKPEEFKRKFPILQH